MKVHTDLIKATIQTIIPLATKTFVAVAPRDSAGKLPTAPYVVIFPAEGTDSQGRLTGPLDTANLGFTLHIVGSSYDNAQTVAELVKAKFVVAGLGVYLTFTGEQTTRCRWSSPTPIQVDNSLVPPLVYSVCELSFESTPI